MMIGHPLRLTDWRIRRFIIVILSIQMAALGIVQLDAREFGIGLIRFVILSIYLAFVPGLLLLRTMRMHGLSCVENVGYSVGLSIAVVMVVGLVVNFLFPPFGISRPLSVGPLLGALSTVVVALCLACYLRDRDYDVDAVIDARDIINPTYALSIMLVVWAVVGTLLLNYKDLNQVAVLLMFAIASVVLLVGFLRSDEKDYPVLLLSVSVALVLHSSLVSFYLWGWDVNYESYVSSLVTSESRWNPSIAYTPNAMLSLTMLAPAYSALCHVPLAWVFKIVFPLMFSLVPVCLFRVFQRYISGRAAFISAFFFMSFFGFYGEMVQLAKQEIAELFLVLLLLVCFDQRPRTFTKSLFAIAFGLSLIVSHYALAYLVLLSMIMVVVLSRMAAAYRRTARRDPIDGALVGILAVSLYLWYGYVSGSAAIADISGIAVNLSRSFVNDLFNPEAAQGLALVLSSTSSPLHEMSKYMQMLAQFLISIGLFSTLLSGKGYSLKVPFSRFEAQYVWLSWAAFFFMLASIAVPYFSSALNTSRLYGISLIFLSPYLVVGAKITYSVSVELRSKHVSRNNSIQVCRILSSFLAVFLLFNSGVIYEIAHDHPSSISFNSKIDYPRFNVKEVRGAEWLLDEKGNYSIHADSYRYLLFAGLGFNETERFELGFVGTPPNSYLYFGSYNIAHGQALVVVRKGVIDTPQYVDSQNFVDNKSRILDNGGAVVFFS